MKEEPCQICGEVLRFEWTDLHGEANCINCQVPYKIYHYDDKNKRVEKPPEISIKEKYIPAMKKYWEEFGKGLGLGNFLGVNPNMQNAVDFHEWLDNNQDLILEEEPTG